MAEIKFSDFTGTYLRHCEVYNTPGTLSGKYRHIRRFITYFAERPLSEVTRNDIESYVATRKNAGAGNPTINRELTTLKNLFSYAVEMGHLEKNPTRGVKLLPELRAPLRVPSYDDVERWLYWCLQNDTLLYDLSAIAVNTGLRRGDILKICGEDIDLDRRVITVAVAKTRGVQYVPLNDVAYRVLARRKIPGYIFNGNNGQGPGHLKNFKRRLDRARMATGLIFRFHDFRHVFACATLEAGANIRTVQVLLGHSRLSTTERYLTVTPEQTRRAVDALKWGHLETEGYTLFDL